MRTFNAASYTSMPWKNGGGSTTELAIFPIGASLDNFDWRISSAQVQCSGPFSRFPGIDRTLAILDGGGLQLELEQQAARQLTPESAPFAFAGESPLTASLLEGTVLDFNVMTRRSRWRHRLQRMTLSGALTLQRRADQLFIYCAAGSAVIDATIHLSAGAACLCGDDDPLQLSVASEVGALLYLTYLTRI